MGYKVGFIIGDEEGILVGAIDGSLVGAASGGVSVGSAVDDTVIIFYIHC